jgi:hypothetical protein
MTDKAKKKHPLHILTSGIPINMAECPLKIGEQGFVWIDLPNGKKGSIPVTRVDEFTLEQSTSIKL